MAEETTPEATALEEADVERIEQLRDELELKAHLLKAELRDQWRKLEKDWARVKEELAPVRRAALETREKVREATAALVKELVEGYERIRDALA